MGKLNTDKACLLVVDVQQGFLNDATAHVPARVEALQHDYRHAAATRFINPEGSSWRRWLHWDRFAPGSDDCALAFDAADHVRVFKKAAYSAAMPDLLGYLGSQGVSEIHLCGIDTDICVMKTAADLFEHGAMRPVVLAEACASHAGADHHDAALMILKRLIGEEQVIVE